MAHKVEPAADANEFETEIKNSIEQGRMIRNSLRSKTKNAEKEYYRWNARNKALLKGRDDYYNRYMSSHAVSVPGPSNMFFHLDKQMEALEWIEKDLIPVVEKENETPSLGAAAVGGFAGLVAGLALSKRRIELDLERLRDLPRKHQIFISSASGDVHEERLEAIGALSDAGYIPMAAEGSCPSDGYRTDRVRRTIDGCDLVVMISSGRPAATDDDRRQAAHAASEAEYAEERGVPVLSFAKEVGSRGMRSDHASAEGTAGPVQIKWTGDDIKGLVVDTVRDELEKDPRNGWVRLKDVCSAFERKG